ncbi:MAG: DUF484 family protein [Pseudomonadota bacterium]
MKEANPGGEAAQTDEPEINEQSVVDFLSLDRDFFVRHPGLLSELNLPHGSGRTVSLVEHQVSILRERNMDMRRRTNELVNAARNNDQIFAKTRSLTLALLDAESRQALNEVLATYVLVDFEADFVCCHLQGEATSLDHICMYPDGLPFEGLLSPDKSTCTTLRQEELQLIFPNSEHDDSGSAALLPLALPDTSGMLCIGSRDAQRFAPDMDTLFVTYIADILGKVLTRMPDTH